MSPRKRIPKDLVQSRYLAIAQLFYDLRMALGLTQVEFAKLVGMSQPLISKVEKAHMPPSLKAFLGAYRAAMVLPNREVLKRFERFMAIGQV